MEQKDISVMGATRINIGLSAIIQVKSGAYTYGNALKILAGGGTLEVVSAPPALTGTSAVVWGTGYPVGATEILSVSGPAVWYFAATGATMTLGIALGYTSGATTL